MIWPGLLENTIDVPDAAGHRMIPFLRMEKRLRENPHGNFPAPATGQGKVMWQCNFYTLCPGSDHLWCNNYTVNHVCVFKLPIPFRPGCDAGGTLGNNRIKQVNAIRDNGLQDPFFRVSTSRRPDGGGSPAARRSPIGLACYLPNISSVIHVDPEFFPPELFTIIFCQTFLTTKTIPC